MVIPSKITRFFVNSRDFGRKLVKNAKNPIFDVLHYICIVENRDSAPTARLGEGSEGESEANDRTRGGGSG